MSMREFLTVPIRRVLEQSGRLGHVDQDLTSRDLFQVGMGRATELARGMLRFRSYVFLGAGVKLRGKRRIRLAKFSAIGHASAIDGISRHGVQLGAGAKLGRYVTVTGTSSTALMGHGLQLGRNSAIGDFGHVGCAGGVAIGDDVIIGPFVTFHSQEHETGRIDVEIRLQGTRQAAITIGNDVWVGSRVTFLAGSIVGAHSVVAAGAVVRGHFAPYSVIGGVPARVIKQRNTNVDEI